MSILSLIIFVLILFILVIIHEAGHFIFAKLSKMRVDEFAFGFPPRLFSFTKGETKYSFNLIPLGGYVKIFGENGIGDEEKESESFRKDLHRSFDRQNFFKKILVLSGGVLFNFLAAVLFFAGSIFLSEKISLSQQDLDSGNFENREVIVGAINEKSNLKNQGLSEGDSILEIKSGTTILSGEKITSKSLIDLVQNDTNQQVQIIFKSSVDGQTHLAVSIPQAGIVDNKKVLGLALVDVAENNITFIGALVEGYKMTVMQTGYIFSELYKLIQNSFGGSSKIQDSLSGPIGLAHATREIGEKSLEVILSFAAMLSISLAVFNILPIPALDGGRILFVFLDEIYKFVFRKKLPVRLEQTVHALGFVGLICLMVFVSYFDILKLL